MGLQIEKVSRKNGQSAPVADFVREEDRDWLQDHRVGLNAMTALQFLEWLDHKFETSVGKVVPPTDILAGQLKQGVRDLLERRLAADAPREARIEERGNEAVQACRMTIRLCFGEH